jgi:predicted DsbA family dithiol-disulfide isomerase
LEYGDEWRFHKRMFKAYFEDLEDIGKLDNVVRIGSDAGLDEASLRQALEEGRYREQVDSGINWSRRIGVTAIPTFVFNQKFAMVGAQEIDQFRYIMNEIEAPKR